MQPIVRYSKIISQSVMSNESHIIKKLYYGVRIVSQSDFSGLVGY